MARSHVSNQQQFNCLLNSLLRQTTKHHKITKLVALSKGNPPVIDGILPKGPYPPCLRMADRALLAGYPCYPVADSPYKGSLKRRQFVCHDIIMHTDIADTSVQQPYPKLFLWKVNVGTLKLQRHLIILQHTSPVFLLPSHPGSWVSSPIASITRPKTLSYGGRMEGNDMTRWNFSTSAT